MLSTSLRNLGPPPYLCTPAVVLPRERVCMAQASVWERSSDAPLGKMRGLITVKLANEQVNYGAKFLYKKCHFSERRSSSRAESLKQAVGEDGVEQEERPRTNRSFPISVSRKVSGFRNSELRSTAFEVERKRLRR
ncbi:hypothetical protein D4764_09G0002410 [Takifugu flavidus]|uniref:Uncharacterized protein n=1 Tax=Takifugu flavidus TaxID=433684 RepID=A0A5C6MJA7_9TELE|nr:hypothetical protein D4764_09G0002410 [Takifugu flavidus]